MSKASEVFFPSRTQRAVLDFVTTEFPFPLALTYHRLQNELDNQEPIAAAWQLRDAFECLLKFAACLASADYLQLEPNSEHATEIASLLLKPTGLSLGDWHTLLELSLKSQSAYSKRSTSTNNIHLPELYNVFFTSKGKRTQLNTAIDSDDKSCFVKWRNDVFGHGVFDQDRQYYADETLRWISTLHRFYEGLHPVIHGWTLISKMPRGGSIIWNGNGNHSYSSHHQHRPQGEHIPMMFVDSALPRELSFGPLLSVQQCTNCRKPAVFFFDKNKYESKLDRHRTYFLEYFRGHRSELRDWNETIKLATLLPPKFIWQRVAFDEAEIVDTHRVVFRDFENEYLRPDYLLDEVWQVIEERSNGYLHITAPMGTGKTYLIRGFEQEGRERNIPVLTYYILPGPAIQFQNFITELGDKANARFGKKGFQEIQTDYSSIPKLQDSLSKFLSDLMDQCHLDNLILAIDGLDELSELEAGSISITKFLPPAHKLPKGCFVLLTSGEFLNSDIQSDIARIKGAGTMAKEEPNVQEYVQIHISPHEEFNQQLLRTYLETHLPNELRSPEQVNVVLDRTNGVFLYAYHFCRALASGVFSDINFLPNESDFYKAYLTKLKARVGSELYENVYLSTLLFLTAARQPIPLSQLIRWGIPKDRLNVALLDLRDFLKVSRTYGWDESLVEGYHEKRVALAHNAFTKFIYDDPQLSLKLKNTHLTIVNIINNTHAGRWEDADPNDPADLYDLLFFFSHLKLAPPMIITAQADAVMEYILACGTSAEMASERNKNHLALSLIDSALLALELLLQMSNSEKEVSVFEGLILSAWIAKFDKLTILKRFREALYYSNKALEKYRSLIAEEGRKWYSKILGVLLNSGKLLDEMGSRQEALKLYDEAIGYYKQMGVKLKRKSADTYASLLINKGYSTWLSGHLHEAIELFDKSISMARGKKGEEWILAQALVNKGEVLRNLGQQREAIVCQDEAITIRRQLISDGQDLTFELADAVMCKGNALLYLGENIKEAVLCARESVELFEKLVSNGRREIRNRLATAHMNLGIILSTAGKHNDALLYLNKANETFQSLIEDEDREELIPEYCKSLINRSALFIALDRENEALSDTEKGIRLSTSPTIIRRIEIPPETLAMLFINRASAQHGLGDFDGVKHSADKGIKIFQQLVDGGRHEFYDQLASAIFMKALALENLAQPNDALNCYDSTIRILKSFTNLENKETKLKLSEALEFRARLLIDLEQLSPALDSFDEAINFLQFQLREDRGYLISELIQVVSYKIITLMELRRWIEVANEFNRLWSLAPPSQEANKHYYGTNRGWQSLLESFSDLTVDDKQCLYSALGERNQEILEFLERQQAR